MPLPATGPSLGVKLMAGVASLGVHAAMIGGLWLLAGAPRGIEAPPPGGGPILFVSLVPGSDRSEPRDLQAAPRRAAIRRATSAPATSAPRRRKRPAVEVSPSPRKQDVVVPEPAAFLASVDAKPIDAGSRMPIAESAPSAPAKASGETSSIGVPPAWPGPGEVDRPARPRWPIRPAYPSRARHRGDEATVVVEAWVDDGGSVAFSTVLDSGGADFDASALDAVAQSTFRPARLSGRNIASRVALRIHFELRD